MMKTTPDLRPSPIAGRWYPAEAKQLSCSVDRYLQQAQVPAIDGDIVAIIVPHAGHLYSGPVAGRAFALLKSLEPELVAIISPMHYPYSQALLTSGHLGYQTPLGPVLIDRPAVQELNEHLRQSLGFGLSVVREDPEHSLEIELPFLQRALKKRFKLLPVMMRDQRPYTAKALGLGLAQILKDRSALLVASTDLSHFYPLEQALSYDREIIKQVEAFNPDGVIEVEEDGKGFACGKGAMASVLWAAKAMGADQVKILHHATSGDVTGDYDQVVGYASAVCYRAKG
jgi:MEMO1 family protein